MENVISIQRRSLVLLLAGLGLLIFGFGNAVAAVEKKKNARINFVHLVGISDWRADGNEAILIEAASKRWYRAEFLTPCYDLPYQDRVGFVTSATGQLNRFSAIVVSGRKCHFKSLERISPPDTKVGAKAP